MQYNIILSDKELELIAKLLQEGPFRIVKPILDNIGRQVDIQNTPKTEDSTLTTNE